MNTLPRRQFIHTAAVLGCAASTSSLPVWAAAVPPSRKMTICLTCGSIGVSADQNEAIRLAEHHGFESVEPYGEFLAGLSATQLDELLANMKAKQLRFGAAGFPVDFRRDDARFTESLQRLPKIAAGLQRAGVDRVGTWLSPCDNSRTYLENFRLHAKRLREAAMILKDHGQRLGLEYVGTKTSRERCRYPFIHTMAETKDLIGEIGTENVGFVLDSWHWWQADDTVADLLSLKSSQIISTDLNDAPANLAKDKQLDGQRELPATTGVIDAHAFLGALQQLDYDGPVRAEPFNKALNELGNDEACAATVAAMKKAFATLG